MKKIFTFLMATGFLLYSNVTLAQDAKPKKNYKGFYTGFSLMSSAWSMPDFDNIESGRGFGVEGVFGYSFNPYFGLYLPISISSFNPDQGANYQLYNYGFGAHLGIGQGPSMTILMIKASYNFQMIYSNLETGDIYINGWGPGLGGGLYIPASEDITIELGYTRYWIDISNVLIGSERYDADGDIERGQFSIGIVRYF